MTSNRNIHVLPANTLSNGVVSHRHGNPVLRFEIGEREEYLLGHTLRLCGRFSAFRNASTDGSGIVPTEDTNQYMSDKLGVYSVLESLSFSTMKTKQNLESIRNYNSFLGSYLPCKSSKSQSMTFMNNQALIMPNFESQRLSIVNNEKTKTGGNSFCLSLVSGLTSGQNPIPLSSQWGIGGLEISINLAPDSNVFYSGDDTSASFSNAYYELSDLYLVAETVLPSPDQLSQLMRSPSNTFEFNTITSFYQTINSTNAIVNLNLGQSNVLGVFGSFVPVSFLNNLTQNGLSSLYPRNLGTAPAVIRSAIFNRANERFPIHYNLDTMQKDNASIESAPIDIVKNFMDAMDNFINLEATSITPANNRVISSNAVGLDYKKVPLGGMTAGIGCVYDKISGNGVSFKNVPFSLQLETDLTTDNPNALYLFVHSRNTLVSKNGSIQIMT